MTRRIIDMRCRPPIPEWTSGPTFRTAMWYPRNTAIPGARSAWEESVDLLFDEMDLANITWGVVMGRAAAGNLGGVDNKAIIRAVESWPDRFVAFLGVDLENIDRSLAEARELMDHPGVKGLSIEPGSAATPRWSDDKSLMPIYETCLDRGVPVSISLSGLLSALGGHDITWSNPVSIQRVAMAMPDLKIVVSHAGWPYTREMVTIALICKNIYVSPDLYTATAHMPWRQDYVDGANLALADRTLFGTAYPTKTHIDSVRDFMEMGWREEIVDHILYDNAAKLLGL
jgi:predicted TIM-barrel fold metal-dependent hydrolase